jgi:hypothetical protein
MVRPERFELPAFWFVARRSIQLSYGRILVNSRIIIPLGRIFVKRKCSLFRTLGTKTRAGQIRSDGFGPSSDNRGTRRVHSGQGFVDF